MNGDVLKIVVTETIHIGPKSMATKAPRPQTSMLRTVEVLFVSVRKTENARSHWFPREKYSNEKHFYWNTIVQPFLKTGKQVYFVR